MHRWALQRICPDSQCLGCMPHPTYLRVAKLCGSQRDSYEGNLELRQPRSHCELAFLLLFSTLATATQVVTLRDYLRCQGHRQHVSTYFSRRSEERRVGKECVSTCRFR